MPKRTMPYYAERRYVLRACAALIDSAFANGDGWLYDDGEPDEFAVRRREKATRTLVVELRRRGAEPKEGG